MIHFLHERAAEAALNSVYAFEKARSLFSSDDPGGVNIWFELARTHEFAANCYSALVRVEERAHGSVFPGVKP